MRRFVAFFAGLLMVFAVQLPAFAANDTEVCQTHGGKHEKTKTLRVNSHALPRSLPTARPRVTRRSRGRTAC